MARIAIIGVGAIGGAIAGLLESAGGHEITLCTRRPLEQLMVTTPCGMVRVQARNITAPEKAEPVEWVIVATKAYDSEAAASWFSSLCSGGAPVAVVQNGVEHRERFAPYIEQVPLLPVVIDCPVERSGDGEVRVRGAALMRVEDTPLGRGFAALFAGSSVKMDLVPDFITAAWWKLCLNSAGALNALTLQPAGLLRDEDMGQAGYGDDGGMRSGGPGGGRRAERCARGAGAGALPRATAGRCQFTPGRSPRRPAHGDRRTERRDRAQGREARHPDAAESHGGHAAERAAAAINFL